MSATSREPERCALCGASEPQIHLCKSHIIPEFAYRGLYDPSHKLVELQTGSPQRQVRRPTGLYQRKFLCDSCERRLSVHEQYAGELLYGRPRCPIRPQVIDGDLWFYGSDYHHFKLFLLSVLWRAGACSVPEFSEVSLGPHQEKLRQLLLGEEPGTWSDYPCLIVHCPNLTNLVGREFVIPPGFARSGEGHRTYCFAFGGLFWDFFVSGHAARSRFSRYFLREDGGFAVLKTDKPWRHFRNLKPPISLTPR